MHEGRRKPQVMQTARLERRRRAQAQRRSPVQASDERNRRKLDESIANQAGGWHSIDLLGHQDMRRRGPRSPAFSYFRSSYPKWGLINSASTRESQIAARNTRLLNPALQMSTPEFRLRHLVLTRSQLEIKCPRD